VPFEIQSRLSGILDAPLELAIGLAAGETRWRGMTPKVLRASQSPLGRREMNLTLVVACALVDADKRVLIAQRPEGKTLAGLWEFPGGKVEPGERPEQTLIRELHEEIGITVSEACLAPLTFASHAYDDFHLLMPLYICRRWDGEVIAREAQKFAWVRANKLRDYPMPPADIPLIPHLIDLLM
jgi:8-oxo-dGTP diphosphatase